MGSIPDMAPPGGQEDTLNRWAQSPKGCRHAGHDDVFKAAINTGTMSSNVCTGTGMGDNGCLPGLAQCLNS